MTAYSRRLKALATLLSSALLSGCFAAPGDFQSLVSHDDFSNSEMLIGAAAKADGSSQVMVILQLKDRRDSPVPAFQPQLKASSSELRWNCTKSDRNGVSVCLVSSARAGQFEIQAILKQKTLSGQIEFRTAGFPESISLQAGSQKLQSGAGYNMEVRLHPMSGDLKSSSGYKLQQKVSN